MTGRFRVRERKHKSRGTSRGIVVVLLLGAPVAARSQAIATDYAPANWIGGGLGTARTGPCPGTQHCDRLAVDARWMREVGAAAYVGVRAFGAFELNLYSGGDVGNAPAARLGDAALLYGWRWEGWRVGIHAGTGLAFGDDQRVSVGRVTQHGYIGLPVDVQIAWRLAAGVRLTFQGLATEAPGVSYRGVGLGLLFAVR